MIEDCKLCRPAGTQALIDLLYTTFTSKPSAPRIHMCMNVSSALQCSATPDAARRATAPLRAPDGFAAHQGARTRGTFTGHRIEHPRGTGSTFTASRASDCRAPHGARPVCAVEDASLLRAPGAWADAAAFDGRGLASVGGGDVQNASQ